MGLNVDVIGVIGVIDLNDLIDLIEDNDAGCNFIRLPDFSIFPPTFLTVSIFSIGAVPDACIFTLELFLGDDDATMYGVNLF
jgi:hypothetical protein